MAQNHKSAKNRKKSYNLLIEYIYCIVLSKLIFVKTSLALGFDSRRGDSF